MATELQLAQQALEAQGASNPSLRAAQQAVEVQGLSPAQLNTSQQVVEVVGSPITGLRFVQSAVEVAANFAASNPCTAVLKKKVSTSTLGTFTTIEGDTTAGLLPGMSIDVAQASYSGVVIGVPLTVLAVTSATTFTVTPVSNVHASVDLLLAFYPLTIPAVGTSGNGTITSFAPYPGLCFSSGMYVSGPVLPNTLVTSYDGTNQFFIDTVGTFSGSANFTFYRGMYVDQGAVEVAVSNAAPVSVSQIPVEVALNNTPTGFFSQIPVETVLARTADYFIAQLPVEAAMGYQSLYSVSQVAVEIVCAIDPPSPPYLNI